MIPMKPNGDQIHSIKLQKTSPKMTTGTKTGSQIISETARPEITQPNKTFMSIKLQKTSPKMTTGTKTGSQIISETARPEITQPNKTFMSNSVQKLRKARIKTSSTPQVVYAPKQLEIRIRGIKLIKLELTSVSAGP